MKRNCRKVQTWENDWLIENTINYDNTFGNHTVSALVGYSAQRNNARGFGAGRKGFPEGFSVIDAGSVSSQNTSGSAWANTMISMFGRVMYSYADRLYAVCFCSSGRFFQICQMETAGAHSRLYLWVGM